MDRTAWKAGKRGKESPSFQILPHSHHNIVTSPSRKRGDRSPCLYMELVIRHGWLILSRFSCIVKIRLTMIGSSVRSRHADPADGADRKTKRTTRRRGAPGEGASHTASGGGVEHEHGPNRKGKGTSAGSYPLDDSPRY